MEDCKRSCSDILKDLDTFLGNNLQVKILDGMKGDVKKLTELLEEQEITFVAVGDSGASISTFLSAFMGHGKTIPTSSYVACTKVPVEITQNKSNDMFEADIHFMSKEDRNEGQQLYHREIEDNSEEEALKSLVNTDKNLNKKLGEIDHISCEDPKSFGKEIEKYIGLVDSRNKLQYWPIVKRIVLRIPKCEILESGIKLVDLPRIRYSNPTRDEIARDYIKDCSVIFIVVDTERVENAKIATQRLMWMDGSYHSVAFVRTNTDQDIDALVRELGLEEEVKIHKDTIDRYQKKKEEYESDLTNIDEKLKQKISENNEDPAQSQPPKREEEIVDLYEAKIKKEEEIGKVKNKIEKEKMKIRIKCETKKNVPQVGAWSAAKVFLVLSSTDFKSLNGKDESIGEIVDGSINMEIEALRDFLKKKQREEVQRVLQSVGQLVHDCNDFLHISVIEDGATREESKKVIARQHKKLFKDILPKQLENLRNTIDRTLFGVLRDGADMAKQNVVSIAQYSGLKHHMFYRAMVKRFGKYSISDSTLDSNVVSHDTTFDFNEELALPFIWKIQDSWKQQFKKRNEQINDFMEDLRNFLEETKRLLGNSVDQRSIDQVNQLLKKSVLDKVHNAKNEVEEKVNYKLENISRSITSIVMGAMIPAYRHCSDQTGPGSYDDIRKYMRDFVDKNKNLLIDQISMDLHNELNSLKDEIMEDLNQTIQEIEELALCAYKLLWDNTFRDETKRKECLEAISTCKKRVDQLLSEYDISLLEEGIQSL